MVHPFRFDVRIRRNGSESLVTEFYSVPSRGYRTANEVNERNIDRFIGTAILDMIKYLNATPICAENM